MTLPLLLRRGHPSGGRKGRQAVAVMLILQAAFPVAAASAAAAPDLAARVLAHRCDDGATIAQVLAHASEATSGAFRTLAPELTAIPGTLQPEVRIPVLVEGERPDFGPDRHLRWTFDPGRERLVVDDPLALMVQLGARPFAFYANRVVHRNGGPLKPEIEQDTSVLDILPCRFPGGVPGLLRQADCQLLYTDLFWSVLPDGRSLEVVVQLQFDRRGKPSTSAPGPIPRSKGVGPPPVHHPFATWSRPNGARAFIPADGYARTISAGKPLQVK